MNHTIKAYVDRAETITLSCSCGHWGMQTDSDIELLILNQIAASHLDEMKS